MGETMTLRAEQDEVRQDVGLFVSLDTEVAEGSDVVNRELFSALVGAGGVANSASLVASADSGLSRRPGGAVATDGAALPARMILPDKVSVCAASTATLKNGKRRRHREFVAAVQTSLEHAIGVRAERHAFQSSVTARARTEPSSGQCLLDLKLFSAVLAFERDASAPGGARGSRIRSGMATKAARAINSLFSPTFGASILRVFTAPGTNKLGKRPAGSSALFARVQSHGWSIPFFTHLYCKEG